MENKSIDCVSKEADGEICFLNWNIFDEFKWTPGSHVYFLKCNGARLFKIGYTKNLKKRIEQLSVKFPYNLELYAYIDMAGRDMEKYVHDRLKKYRLNGEWFFGKSCLKAIKDLFDDIACTGRFEVKGRYDNILGRLISIEQTILTRQEKEFWEKEALKNAGGHRNA